MKKEKWKMAMRRWSELRPISQELRYASRSAAASNARRRFRTLLHVHLKLNADRKKPQLDQLEFSSDGEACFSEDVITKS